MDVTMFLIMVYFGVFFPQYKAIGIRCPKGSSSGQDTSSGECPVLMDHSLTSLRSDPVCVLGTFLSWPLEHKDYA